MSVIQKLYKEMPFGYYLSMKQNSKLLVFRYKTITVRVLRECFNRRLPHHC